MRGYLVAGVLTVAVTVALLHSNANACSCFQGGVYIASPLAGAVDVPLDAPLVVQSAQLARVVTTLVAEDGTPIELVERRRMVGQWECGHFPLAFLGPRHPLQPNTRYVVSASLGGAGNAPLSGSSPAEYAPSLGFVTGTGNGREDHPEIALKVFAAQSASGSLVEAYLHTDAPVPLFVLGQTPKGGVTRRWNPWEEQPLHLSLGNVECADVLVVDVAGRPVLEEKRCQPSKCTEVNGFGIDTCGGEPFPGMSWSDWQNIPDGCGDGREVVIGDADSAADDAGGCALAPSRTTSFVPPLWTLALALLIHRRGRRRGAA